jgi:pyruvate-ferredoxin/flavodoxin oxidoreductase
LLLDSRRPTTSFKELASKETRFAMLGLVDKAQSERLLLRAQQDIDDRWQLYEQMVELHRTAQYSEVAE